MFAVATVGPADAEVLQLLDRMPAISRAILFSGDRWSPVEVVAVLRANKLAVGLASLAPVDEMGGDQPTIIGLWIDPANRGAGAAKLLLQQASHESLERYGRPPHVTAITPAGLRALVGARASGVAIEVVSAVTGMELP